MRTVSLVIAAVQNGHWLLVLLLVCGQKHHQESGNESHKFSLESLTAKMLMVLPDTRFQLSAIWCRSVT